MTGDAVARHRRGAGRRRHGRGGLARGTKGGTSDRPEHARSGSRWSSHPTPSTSPRSRPPPISSCRARASRSGTRRSRQRAAHDVPVRSEIDLAGEIASSAGRPTIVAVTGTNGKTTVTELAADILQAAGVVGGRGGQHRPSAARRRPGRRRRRGRRGVLVPARVHRGVRAARGCAPEPRRRSPRLAPHVRRVRARRRRTCSSRQGADDVLVFNADDPVVAGARGRGAGSQRRVLDRRRRRTRCADRRDGRRARPGRARR